MSDKQIIVGASIGGVLLLLIGVVIVMKLTAAPAPQVATAAQPEAAAVIPAAALTPTPKPVAAPAPFPSPKPVVSAPPTAPVVTPVAAPAPPPPTELTIEAVDAFAKILREQIDRQDKLYLASTKTNGIVYSYFSKSVSTDLKASDSLVYPRVGEIVLDHSRSAESKENGRLIYSTMTTYLWTIRVGRKDDKWKCMKCTSKQEFHIQFPPTDSPDASEKETDMTSKIQEYIDHMSMPDAELLALYKVLNKPTENNDK